MTLFALAIIIFSVALGWMGAAFTNRLIPGHGRIGGMIVFFGSSYTFIAIANRILYGPRKRKGRRLKDE